MGKVISEIQKGDVVWAPYRSCPPWPALIRNVYPKKVTYVFFPLPPAEDLESSSRKVLKTFSCIPKQVRLMTVHDRLPTNSPSDLIEAFDAAKNYLKENSSQKNVEEAQIVVASAPEKIGSNVAQTKVEQSPNSTEEILQDQDENMKEETFSSNGKDVESNKPLNGGVSSIKNDDKKVSEEAPASNKPTKRKGNDDATSRLAKRQPIDPSPPRAAAFAADSTTHLDTSPSPDLLAPIIFREATTILEHIWTTDLVQNYQAPPRSNMVFETHTGGLLTDHETDSLFDHISCWVREREKDAYMLPGVHLVLNVLMPEVIIQGVMQLKARGVTREAAERMVMSAPSECVPSCSSSTSSVINSSQSPRNASTNGSNNKCGGSLDELARIACKERESITE